MFPALAIASALILPAPDAKPSAMVLATRGAVEVTPARGAPHPVAPKDLLYPGDRLTVPPGGEATLAFLGVGTRGRVRPGSEVTIGPSGVAPAEAIEQIKPVAPAVAEALKGVRPAAGNGR